jgi:hypothetical protein
VARIRGSRGKTVSIGGLATTGPAERSCMETAGQNGKTGNHTTGAHWPAVLLDPAPVGRIESIVQRPHRHDTTRHGWHWYCRNYSDVLCPRGPQGAWPNDCHAGPTRVVPSVGSQLRRRRAGPEILPVRAQYRILRHETNVQST